jgi:metallophosphoesterase (TIGR03767 family)
MSMGHLDRRTFLRHGLTLAAGAALASRMGPLAAREAWARTRDVVAFPAGTTYESTIVPIGTRPYSRLEYRGGWPLVVRTGLGVTGKPNREMRRVTVASILQLTDVQVPDAQSPARVEWLSRYGEIFRAAWRPHETVVNHISEAAVRRSRTVGRGPVTGRYFDCAINTGDNIDNMQLNELRWFLSLMNGGTLAPNSGHPATYHGVQEYWRAPEADDTTFLNAELFRQQFPDGYDDYYYRPDVPPTGFTADEFKREHGYPELPGFLTAAVEPFEAIGLDMPWFSLYGNHDGLVQGNVPQSPELQTIATGFAKIVGFPPNFPWSEQGALQLFGALLTLSGPQLQALLAQAPMRLVPPDANRRLIGPHEYVQTHLDWPSGTPRGHGFTQDNLGDGATPVERDLNTTLYYTFRPVAGAPVLGVALDTTNRLGGAEGSIGSLQLAWLEAQLRAVSSRWFDAQGRLQRDNRVDDHLVVLFAHHNINTMDNLVPSPDDPQRVSGEQLKAVLQRYPNVVAFVNGHSHINRIWAHPDSSRRTGGFWEIATSAQLDYPMQTRAIELVDNRDRTLSLFCSLIDQAGHADPRSNGTGTAYSLFDLAGYGRELAYNDPRDHEQGGDPFDYRVGAAGDRNVELLIAAPFSLGAPGPPERVLRTIPERAAVRV